MITFPLKTNVHEARNAKSQLSNSILYILAFIESQFYRSYEYQNETHTDQCPFKGGENAR